jgi:hypothetical protein
VYVEEYYSPAPVIVRRPPCCDHVGVGSRRELRPELRREVYAYPCYRERVIVHPSPLFTFGIFN